MPLPEHIQALLQSCAYPHQTEDIHLLETHISWIILTGSYAYKIKKPLDLGFLDFSTLARRQYYCQRELELNRRFASDIYIDVLPIGRTATGFRLGEGRPVVDYCLKMQQFNPHHLLIQLLRDGAFNARWMDILARDLAHFHSTADIVHHAETDHHLWQHIQDNFDTAQQHMPNALNTQCYEDLRQWFDDEFRHNQHQLRQRQQEGFVRDCHGDLHLRNIALIHGHPTPFDCIEFNDTLREIDVLNDIAFLLMDCDAHQHSDLGFRFLSRYLEQNGDYAGLGLLPLFLCYRACVRGKVACILASEQSGMSQQKIYQEARHYFALAETYTHRPQPTLFVIGGLSGSGKSHLALQGCGPEQAIIIRSDATRKRIALSSPDLPLYGDEMHRHTYHAMFDAARETLAAGFSVILDATFLHPESRQQLRQLARTCATPLRAYWLDIPEATLRKNIHERQRRGQDISEADIRVLELQLHDYHPPTEAWWQWLHSASRWPA